jgi:hypothetical protein
MATLMSGIMAVNVNLCEAGKGWVVIPFGLILWLTEFDILSPFGL